MSPNNLIMHVSGCNRRKSNYLTPQEVCNNVPVPISRDPFCQQRLTRIGLSWWMKLPIYDLTSITVQALDLELGWILHPIILCSLPWPHNKRDGVSNHRRLDCSLKHLFRYRWKKTPKLCVTGLWEGKATRKGPVQRKMFPFHDVIIGCDDLYMTQS